MRAAALCERSDHQADGRSRREILRRMDRYVGTTIEDGSLDFLNEHPLVRRSCGAEHPDGCRQLFR